MNNFRARLVREAAVTRGLTLIEIMVVIVIMGVLASLVGVAVIEQMEQAKCEAAVNQVRNFMAALDHYKVQIGKYPTSSEGLQSLTNPPKGRPVMNEIPPDPWGGQYTYISPGSNSKAGYDISSAGPDGSPGGADDIKSWDLKSACGGGGAGQ